MPRFRPASRIALCGTLMSLFLHASALVVLATVGWWQIDNARPRFFGQTIVLEAAMRAAAPLEVSVQTLLPSDSPVVITPTWAQVVRHRFHELPSTESRDWLPAFDEFELAVADVPQPRRQTAEATPTSAPSTEPPPLQRQPPTATLPRDAQADPPPKPATSVPSAAPSTSSAAERSPLGEPDAPPDFTHNPPPTYPELARRNRWEGRVLLRLTIDETGRVTKVEIAQSSGHDVLDAAAANAVRQWRGRPAHRDGRPTSSIELLPVRFRLN